MKLRSRICGWCGGPNYGCDCRDNETRVLLAIALFVLVLTACVARSAFGQESASVPVLASRSSTAAAVAVSVNTAAGARDVTPRSPAPSSRSVPVTGHEPPPSTDQGVNRGAPERKQASPAFGREVDHVSAGALVQGQPPAGGPRVEAAPRSAGPATSDPVHDGSTHAGSAEKRAAVGAPSSGGRPEQPSEMPRAPAEPGAGSFPQAGPNHSARAPFALQLARTIANEDSRPLRPITDGGTAGELTQDARAIYQTVLAWASWQHTTPLRALRALAPHVTAAKPALNPRHALYGSLPASGAARPALWVDAKHGPWTVYGDNWARFRDNVARLVSGGAERVCDGSPIAWGNREDEKIARARGLVKLACGERNSFWALPTERVLTAGVARGRGAQ